MSARVLLGSFDLLIGRSLPLDVGIDNLFVLGDLTFQSLNLGSDAFNITLEPLLIDDKASLLCRSLVDCCFSSYDLSLGYGLSSVGNFYSDFGLSLGRCFGSRFRFLTRNFIL